MPLSKHYGGHGEKVMKAMKKTYGKEKSKKVFYATENKHKGAGPSKEFLTKMKKRMK